jgi:hypothetical protein
VPCAICAPVSVPPVKLIPRVCGEGTSHCAPSDPLSLKKFATPRGSPSTSEKTWARSVLTWAVWPGILHATVHPAANAGLTERIHRIRGEFQGVMMPATPTGSRKVREISSGLGWPLSPLSVRAIALQ